MSASQRQATARSVAFPWACAKASSSPGHLLGKPDILVLDEPANGLDPQGIAWLRDFLRFYASERTAGTDGGRIVIVSSHLLSEAQLIVDDVIVLNAGRLAAQGKLADLLSAASGQ